MIEQGSSNEQTTIEKIIEEIGNAGPFQKRFNIIFNCAVSLLLSMMYMNMIASLALPDHWCHVPGREDGNYTLEEWKNLTIPKKLDAYGVLDYSKCTRFANVSDIQLALENDNTIIKCNQGWEYDHTWYDQTAPMQNNWVCDNALVPSNSLAFGRVGEIIGTLLFGQLADNFGRMPIFYITLLTVIIGRIMSVFTSAWKHLFFISIFVGSVSGPIAFQGPFVITMEISGTHLRPHIGFTNLFYWSIGMLILPVCMWVLRDWSYFILATTLPSILFFFTHRWFIESPRWLVTKGKIRRCTKALQKIAKVNKTEVPNDLEEKLSKIYRKQGNAKVHTVLSLFSSWRLAKNAMIMIYCTSITITIYVCFVINVGTMSGNPFLQYIFQSLAEFPSYYVGKWFCNRYGRRWTAFFGFVLATSGCIFAFFFVYDSSNYWIISMICVFIKFSFSTSVFAMSIMNMEIFPTCVRQTGISVSGFVASLLSILAPYVIALGVSVNAIIPFVVYGVAFFIAVIGVLFLPETRGLQMPETLKDAAEFGVNQDIFGRTKRSTRVVSNNAPMFVHSVGEFV